MTDSPDFSVEAVEKFAQELQYGPRPTAMLKDAADMLRALRAKLTEAVADLAVSEHHRDKTISRVSDLTTALEPFASVPLVTNKSTGYPLPEDATAVWLYAGKDAVRGEPPDLHIKDFQKARAVLATVPTTL